MLAAVGACNRTYNFRISALPMHNIKQMAVDNVHAGEYVSNLDAVDDAMDEHAMIMLCSSREAYHRSCTRLCPGGKPGSDRSADAGDH